MALSDGDFQYISTLVREQAAIVLEKGKEYLVESRLAPLARQEGFDSIGDLVARLSSRPLNDLHSKVVEAMTTNETSWFRDIHPFEALNKVIVPEFMKKREAERSLYIWCAACSSGQEPYSIAILLREHFPALESWRVKIIACDFSNEMVEYARQGRYSQLEVNRGLAAPLLVKYFNRNGLEWQLKDEVRRMVEIQQMNLIEPWPPLPSMDVIFLRNVLIYFDMATKKAILERLHNLLKPDGYLFLGGAETTFHIDDSFERVQLEKTIGYRLRGG